MSQDRQARTQQRCPARPLGPTSSVCPSQDALNRVIPALHPTHRAARQKDTFTTMSSSSPLLPLLLTAALAGFTASLPASTSLAHDAMTAPQIPKISAQEEERLRGGKLILHTERDSAADGAGIITGVIEVNATPEDIWRVLLRFESIPQSSKAMKEADRYFDDKGATHRVINMRYMLKVAWVEIVYHVHHDYFPGKNYLVWALDGTKDNGIAATIGSFSTWPGSAPGKTRFLYRTMVDTGRNIPDWVEEDLSESSLKSYIKYVKKTAEK